MTGIEYRTSATTLSMAGLVFGFLALSVLPGSAQNAVPSPGSSLEEIQKYCTNIADPARDQRYLLQKQDLEKLQAEVNQRIAVLEKRKAEYQDWLSKRDDFMKKAENGLVDIYKTMAPDAAAPQLALVNPFLAAAIVMKLPAKQSSAILAEMQPDKAAIIAGIMSSAADPTTSKG